MEQDRSDPGSVPEEYHTRNNANWENSYLKDLVEGKRALWMARAEDRFRMPRWCTLA